MDSLLNGHQPMKLAQQHKKWARFHRHMIMNEKLISHFNRDQNDEL